MTPLQKSNNQSSMVAADLLDAASMLTRLAESIGRGERCADKIGNVTCNLVRAASLQSEAEGTRVGLATKGAT